MYNLDRLDFKKGASHLVSSPSGGFSRHHAVDDDRYGIARGAALH
jgi:hypothetical protein